MISKMDPTAGNRYLLEIWNGLTHDKASEAIENALAVYTTEFSDCIAQKKRNIGVYQKNIHFPGDFSLTDEIQTLRDEAMTKASLMEGNNIDPCLIDSYRNRISKLYETSLTILIGALTEKNDIKEHGI